MKRSFYVQMIPALALLVASLGFFSVALAQENSEKTRKHYSFVFEDEDAENLSRSIQIEDMDGQKKVTVVTDRDGERTEEVYEGEEAEKWLEENSTVTIHTDSGSPEKVIVLSHNGSGNGDYDVQIDSLVQKAMKDCKKACKDMEKCSKAYMYSMNCTKNRSGDGDNEEVIRWEDIETVENMEELQNMLQDMDVDIDLSELDGKTVQTVVISKTIRIEDPDPATATTTEDRTLKFSALEMYPNPTNGQFQYRLETQKRAPLTVRVRDLNGRVLEVREHAGKGMHAGTFDLSGQPKGIYLLEFEQSGRKHTRQLVIE